MNFFKPNFWDKNQTSFLSILLFPFVWIFKLIVLVKRLFTKEYKSSIPVICVGNIYLGGTGKTPMSIELFSVLRNLKMNPVFIRKKYNSFEDEANLQKSLGPIIQNKKRVDAIKEAVKNNANVAILDDGFQDFSIFKDFSIVCFNENIWIGNGYVIPAGPLREELTALKRANCVIINGKKNLKIENRIQNINKSIKIFYSKYKAKNIDKLENKKIIAFAGIASPENFFNLLNDNNITLQEKIKFPDHYKYSDKILENLTRKAKLNDAILVTTEKDYFRIDQKYKPSINFIKIEVEIENKTQLIEEIKKII